MPHVATLSGMRSKNLIHEDDLEWWQPDPDSGFGARRRQLGRAAGAREIGTSLFELEPGRRAFPYHFHHGNEEAIYVLEGEATLRQGDGEHTLRAGDYVAFVRGEAGAHQIRNDGDAVFRFLCISTMQEPDVVGYPDTGKFGLFAGAAPGGKREERTLACFVRGEPRLGYLDGEPGGR